MMPVSAQVGGVFGDDDQVKGTRLNGAVAAGTGVALASRVGLDGCDDLV
jgi:hypothetical protein